MAQKELDNSYYTCYVCKDIVKLEIDRYCVKNIDGEKRFRHLWHGVPGITRAVATVCGFTGYAATLELAKARAEYYMSNGFAAPEVQAGEKEILEEVNRLEKLDEEKRNV